MHGFALGYFISMLLKDEYESLSKLEKAFEMEELHLEIKACNDENL